MDEKRITQLNNHLINENGKCVIYWMQKSQRAFDNPALEYASDIANSINKPLLVYFGIYSKYPLASKRMFQFILEGLKETAQHIKNIGAGFCLRCEEPWMGVVKAADEFKAAAVVTDDDYLNTGRHWKKDAAEHLSVRMYKVDADTVVPVRISDHEEWGAYTIRPKILKALPAHLKESDVIIIKNKWLTEISDSIDLSDINPSDFTARLETAENVSPIDGIVGGYTNALKKTDEFISKRLTDYKHLHNEIGLNITSEISPYLHFGQISPLRIALIIENTDIIPEAIDAYLEQLIVRRELAINYCTYNQNYDSLDAAPDWARKSLEAHRWDDRPEIYSLEELENAQTNDELWNAAQKELLHQGKIHNYMRMLWAKKILQWSVSPEEALSTCIYLNDKYALDGRDPNGYANIAWCIFGKHDRAFMERPIFGKIRYMTTDSTKKKTKWQDYIKRIENYNQY